MSRVSIVLKTQGAATYELFQVSTKESIDEVKRKIGSEKIHSQLHLYWQGKFRNSKLFETIQELGYDPAKIEFEKDTDAVVIFKIFPQTVYQAKETKKLFDPNKTVIKDKKGYAVITRKKKEKETGRNLWTPEEDALLFSASVEEVAKVLGRSEKSVSMRIYRLKVDMPKIYNKLIENQGGIESISLTNQSKKMANPKVPVKRKSWVSFSKFDDAVIFACKSNQESAKLLGRDHLAISRRKSNLKRKEPKYFAELQDKFGSLVSIKQRERKYEAIRDIEGESFVPVTLAPQPKNEVVSKPKTNDYLIVKAFGTTIKYPGWLNLVPSIDEANVIVFNIDNN